MVTLSSSLSAKLWSMRDLTGKLGQRGRTHTQREEMEDGDMGAGWAWWVHDPLWGQVQSTWGIEETVCGMRTRKVGIRQVIRDNESFSMALTCLLCLADPVQLGAGSEIRSNHKHKGL